VFSQVAALACLLAVFPTDNGDHDRGMVAVALPPNITPAMKESLSRLKGEALSVGFEVRFIQTDTPDAPLAHLEMLTQGMGPAAVVAFASQADPAGATARQLDVWFLDRATGKTSVARLRTVEGEEDRAEVILAVRAVDFIRARMFDTLAQRRLEPAPRPPAPGRFFVATGVALWHAFAGFPASLLPTAHVGFAPWPSLRLQGEIQAFGTRATHHGREGLIRLEQRFMGVGATWTQVAWPRVRPLASLALGHYHADVDGQPTAGFQGQHLAFSCLAAKLAAGLSLPLPRHAEASATVGTLWLAKHPLFYSVATEVGRVGRPSYTAELTLGMVF